MATEFDIEQLHADFDGSALVEGAGSPVDPPAPPRRESLERFLAKLDPQEIARRLEVLNRKVVAETDMVHASRTRSHVAMVEASRAVERARVADRELQAAMVELRRTEHTRAMYLHAAAATVGQDGGRSEVGPRAKKKRKRRKKPGPNAPKPDADDDSTSPRKGPDVNSTAPVSKDHGITKGSKQYDGVAVATANLMQSALREFQSMSTADDGLESEDTVTEESSLDERENDELFQLLAFRAVQRGGGDTGELPPQRPSTLVLDAADIGAGLGSDDPAVSDAMSTLRQIISEDGATLSSAAESATEDLGGALPSDLPRGSADPPSHTYSLGLRNDTAFDVLLFEAIHSFRGTAVDDESAGAAITVLQALEEVNRDQTFRENSLLPVALSALRMDGKRALRLGLDIYLNELSGAQMRQLAEDATNREAAAYLAAKKLRAHNYLKECCEAEALVADYQLLRRRIERWIRNATAVGSATVAAVTSQATDKVVQHVTNLSSSTAASVTNLAAKTATITNLVTLARAAQRESSDAARIHSVESSVADKPSNHQKRTNLTAAIAELEREQAKLQLPDRGQVETKDGAGVKMEDSSGTCVSHQPQMDDPSTIHDCDRELIGIDTPIGDCVTPTATPPRPPRVERDQPLQATTKEASTKVLVMQLRALTPAEQEGLAGATLMHTIAEAYANTMAKNEAQQVRACDLGQLIVKLTFSIVCSIF